MSRLRHRHLDAGTSLAQRGDAVVVTINYRLGAFGFVNLNVVTGGRIPASGNEGLLDQVKALEWVRDNIERFGSGPQADALTESVQDAWLKFATDGDPRTDALADWRPYDGEVRSTAICGSPLAVESDPYGEERAVWDTVESRLGSL